METSTGFQQNLLTNQLLNSNSLSIKPLKDSKKNKIKHESVDWDSNHNRIILYADIMGFKEKINSTQHDIVTLELRDFIKEL